MSDEVDIAKTRSRPRRPVTKKEIAHKAGVDPRTLRRMERGERVSERTMRSVAVAMGEVAKREGDVAIVVAPYLDALDALTKFHAITVTYCVRFVLFFVCPMALIGFLGFGAEALGAVFVVGIGHAESVAFDGIVSCTLLAVFLLGAWSFRRNRIEDRRMVERSQEHVPVVLDGIRLGAIRYLDDFQYRAVAKSAGERALVQAVKSSPAGSVVVA